MEGSSKGHKKRLRERYEKDGLKGFHNYEVLELMLSYSIIRKDTKDLARKLLKRFGSLTESMNAPLESLLEVDGIGERTAVLIKLFKDVGDFHLKEDILARHSLNFPKEVYEYFKFHFKGKHIEEFIVVYLSSSNRVIDVELLFKGTIDRSAIYVRELIKKVLSLKSTSIIIVHNHPSGDTTPSRDDRDVTKKIKKALSHIDVALIDHLIIGGDKFFSFKENNLL